MGNGRNITIRDDPWIPDIEGFRPRPRGNSSTNFALVAHLIDGKSKQWDHSKVLEAFDPQIVTKVLNIHISLQEKDDKICWAPSTNASFSVKKAYHIDQHRRFTTKTPLQKKD